jgi:hypothetical protein
MINNKIMVERKKRKSNEPLNMMEHIEQIISISKDSGFTPESLKLLKIKIHH